MVTVQGMLLIGMGVGDRLGLGEGLGLGDGLGQLWMPPMVYVSAERLASKPLKS